MEATFQDPCQSFLLPEVLLTYRVVDTPVIIKSWVGTTMYVCMYKYRLDAETKGSTRFRIPTALSCSVPSAARTLLRAGGILNRVDPIGRGV